jgi:hypothetical protein
LLDGDVGGLFPLHRQLVNEAVTRLGGERLIAASAVWFVIGLEVPVSRWSLEHAGVTRKSALASSPPRSGSSPFTSLLAALGILAFHFAPRRARDPRLSLLGAAIRGVNLPSGSHWVARRSCAQSFLRDGSPLPTSTGIDNHAMILAVIFNRCAKCRQILAGLCLCAVLGTSVAAGAKPPPPRAVGPIASTAIGTASTYVGQVRFVDDQVNGNVYKAVREDEQRRRIALYDAEPLVASNPPCDEADRPHYWILDATGTGFLSSREPANSFSRKVPGR